MDDLERLVGLEGYEEMLGVLTPKQLVVVALRLEGLNGEEIGELLGLDRQAVHARLRNARGRLLRRFPELEPKVEGRRMEVGLRKRQARRVDSRLERAGMTGAEASCG